MRSYKDDLYADIQPSYKDSLTHFGIKGMKWGVRRYQNPDGSLTPKGKKRYNNIADRGDKLRKQGVSTTDAFALPTKLKPFMFVPGVNIPFMAMDIQNRKAIDASIQREHLKKLVKQDKVIERNRIAFEKAQKDREDAFKKVYGKDAKLDYMRIYKEMSKDRRFKNLLESEDPDDYRAAESAWRKKHGV